MKISSAFDHNHPIPVRYTCMGINISPPLYFKDLPQGTKSMTLIFEDADATPKPWTHWMVFNIPPSTLYIEAGQVPLGGTEGLANNHTFGYEGPCPKYFKGTHHYWFRLYALDKVLDLPAASEREDVEAQMQGHILGTAELSGLCIAPENEESKV